MSYGTQRTTSLFANPVCIMAWRAEAARIAPLAMRAHNIHYMQNALVLLDELYCLKNPHQKNPLHVRQGVFASILESSLTGYPFAMFFEGLARKEGFGCGQDVKSGQALIQIAVARKCAEALNYEAVRTLKQNVLGALTMLRDAAHSGHAQALSNFRCVAQHYSSQLKSSKILTANTSLRIIGNSTGARSLRMIHA